MRYYKTLVSEVAPFTFVPTKPTQDVRLTKGKPMRPINVRTLMIAAVSAAVLAGTVVPANAAELTDPGAPAEVAAAAEEQPATTPLPPRSSPPTTPLPPRSSPPTTPLPPRSSPPTTARPPTMVLPPGSRTAKAGGSTSEMEPTPRTNSSRLMTSSTALMRTAT